LSNHIPHTVADLLAGQAIDRPDACAVTDAQGIEFTYRALTDRVATLAGQIAHALPRTSRRPRIAIILPNGLDMTVALLASSIVGEAAPLNPALTVAELVRYFQLMRVSALLVLRGETHEAAALAEGMGIRVLSLGVAGTLDGVESQAKGTPPQPDDIAMVLLTSGSTGVPKIVPLSHGNVCRSASDVARSVGLGPQDRCLVMWQQFHIGGLVDLLLAPLLAGGTLIVTPGFDAANFFQMLARARPTWFQGVPTSLGALVIHAERNRIAPCGSSLRFIRSVAAALTPATQASITEIFGVPVVRTLGMTEAGPLITSTALPPAIDKPGSVGRPCGPELRVFGPAMEVLPCGHSGEIAIRGENVFAGYEDDPEANSLAFRDGWFFTGDNGYVDDDGHLFLTGRTKEQINRGGYKIMPPEVEEALSRHPSVQEAAVFGVAHPTLGEDVAAAVSLRDGAGVTAEELRVHLAGLLAAHKVPGRIMVMAMLPRNAVGKIDRPALTRHAADVAQSATEGDAPRSALERFLVELWGRELALPKVGIHQDFATIGGDSLSALRIFMALQEMFARPVPDELVTDARTVAEAAALLEGAGFVLSAEQTQDAALSAVRLLDATVVGTEDLPGRDGFAEALRQARNRTEVGAAFEGLKVYETPAAIMSVLRRVDPAQVGTLLALPFRFLLRRKTQTEMAALTQEIVAGGAAALAWQRKDVTSSAILYGAPAHSAAGKTLIVGFTGKLLRLQLPSYRFLLHLDPARFDLLLLRDSSHRLFAHGLPEIGDSISELGQWLDGFADRGSYGRRIALGTSGGGLAAIHTGIALRWDRAVASSPPSPLDHAELGEALGKLAAAPAVGRPQVVVTHSRNQRDMDRARHILDLFPGARVDPRNEFTSHNVLESAFRAGKLGKLFADWFD